MSAAPPPFDLARAREAFRAAGELHAQATREGAAALSADDFELLRARDAEFVRAAGAGRIEDAIDADDAFHRVLLDAAGDPDLQVGVDLLLPRMRRMDLWHFARQALGGRPSTHPEIIAALEAGDADRAAQLVERSFVVAGEELAAAVERAG